MSEGISSRSQDRVSVSPFPIPIPVREWHEDEPEQPYHFEQDGGAAG